ncbi:MAG: pyridoxamine kinase [Ruminococcus sp.]|nr:pyridoxamine kinase [Ruminococcus sp.]
MKQKRILCINDISSMGKCSLSVALPIISSLGIEAVVLPTALLSAHTVFSGYTFSDQTEEMKKILNHFDSMGEKFDCIYTGYLGSVKQVDIVSDFIDNHPESIVITDPVMGDNGKLYSGFGCDYPSAVEKLCKRSDIILPNLTEACLLTKTPYIAKNIDSDYLAKVMDGLSKISKKSVVTGVKEGKDISVYIGEGKGKYCLSSKSPLIDRQFHGTGDTFASAFAGFFTLGLSLEQSAKNATEFTQMCIEHTNNDKDSQWYGLRFEECLHHLYDMKRDASNN